MNIYRANCELVGTMADKMTTHAGSGEYKDNRKQKRVNDILRDGRLAKDQELKDVSDNLRIRLPFLEAIEAGQYQELPGTTYAIGFVRGYADYLGIDSAKLVDQFKMEAAELENRTELHFPEPLPGGRIPGGAIFFVCIVLAVVFYGGWVFVSSNGKPIAEIVSELPANLAEMIGVETSSPEVVESPEVPAVVTVVENEAPVSAPEDNTVETPEAVIVDAGEAIEEIVETVTEPEATEVGSQVAEVVTETAVVAAPAPVEESQPVVENAIETVEPAVAVSVSEVADAVEENIQQQAPASEVSEAEEVSVVSEPVPVAEIVTEVVATEPSPAEDMAVAELTTSDPIPSPPVVAQMERKPRVYGEENSSARIVITANTPTWVEVTAPSGELMLTRLLNKDDSYRVPDATGLTLVTGNAGGLDFTVDGKAVPAIGPVGSVRRDVLLDAESLKKGPDL